MRKRIRSVGLLMPTVVLFVGQVLYVTPSATAAAQPVRWFTNLNSAAQEARRLKKPLFVEVTATWCGYCRQLKQQTLTDEAVLGKLRQCFVPVAIDADENEALLEAIGVSSLPTMLIVEPDLRIAERITGFRTAGELSATLLKACRNHDAHSPKTAVPRNTSRVSSSGGGIRDQAGTSATDTGRARIRTATGAASGDAGMPPIPTSASLNSASGAGTAAARSSASPAPTPATTPDVAPAFGGYCLVSMLENEQLTRGRQQYFARYRGRLLWFRSADYRDRFLSAPERYWPQASGRDIVALVDQRTVRPGNPALTLVYRDRLWFLADEAAQQRFLQQPDYYVQAAAQFANDD